MKSTQRTNKSSINQNNNLNNITDPQKSSSINNIKIQDH